MCCARPHLFLRTKVIFMKRRIKKLSFCVWGIKSTEWWFEASFVFPPHSRPRLLIPGHEERFFSMYSLSFHERVCDVLVSCLWCALGRYVDEGIVKKSPFTARNERNPSKCNFSAQQFSSVSTTHAETRWKVIRGL